MAGALLEDAAIIEHEGFDLDVRHLFGNGGGFGEGHVARQDQPARTEGLAQLRAAAALRQVATELACTRSRRETRRQALHQAQVADDQGIATEVRKAPGDLFRGLDLRCSVVLGIEHQRQRGSVGMRSAPPPPGLHSSQDCPTAGDWR